MNNNLTLAEKKEVLTSIRLHKSQLSTISADPRSSSCVEDVALLTEHETRLVAEIAAEEATPTVSRGSKKKALQEAHTLMDRWILDKSLLTTQEHVDLLEKITALEIEIYGTVLSA